MKKVIAIIIISLSCIGVQAQFKYDKNKIETIRWTPNPKQITGLDKHVTELNGSWKFSTKPEQGFEKKDEPQSWDNIEVPGEWVMQGFDVEPATYAGYFRTFDV